MKRHIESLLQIALKQLQESGELPAIPAHIQVDATKDKQYGDFATNIAMILASLVDMAPRKIAERIIATLQVSPYVQKVEIAGPGFINFFLTPQALNDVVARVLAEKEKFGRCKMGRGKRILIEFLSSYQENGPLRVHHGRYVAFGAVVSNLLDAIGFKTFREYCIHDMGKAYCDAMISDIREDLNDFGVQFDNWFSLREFVEANPIEKSLGKLQINGHLYERDGALWFRSTDFNDDKDRIISRTSGQFTDFANDVAYHINKFERGFDIAIDIFGSDFQGSIPCMKAALEASGINPERLIHLMVQWVIPARQHSITKETLRELRKEVGNDAARFFFLTRKIEHQIEFDKELAKTQSHENPVYYVQYAYARMANIFRQAKEQHLHVDEANGLSHVSLLSQREERQILNTLSRYPDMIIHAALHYEPYLLTHYLRDLAADFHAYYDAHPFLVDDTELRDARMALVAATQQTLLNGFNILGITAPESM